MSVFPEVPTSPGRYVVRDYEVVEGFDLVTSMLAVPVDKADGPRGGPQLGERVFVHRLANDVDRNIKPSFFLLETHPPAEEPVLYLVDECDAVPYPFDEATRAEVMAEAARHGSEGHRTDQDGMEDFNRRTQALTWAEELGQMSPQPFTISR